MSHWLRSVPSKACSRQPQRLTQGQLRKDLDTSKRRIGSGVRPRTISPNIKWPAGRKPDPDIAGRQCTQDVDPIQRTDREGSVSCLSWPSWPGLDSVMSARCFFSAFTQERWPARVDGCRRRRCRFQSSQSCSAASQGQDKMEANFLYLFVILQTEHWFPNPRRGCSPQHRGPHVRGSHG